MEAELSRTGHRLRDICRTTGDPERLTLRELHWRFKHAPSDSPLARSLSDHGFSILELLVMENGIASHHLNPRHPFLEAERAQVKSRNQFLKERQAYYAARRSHGQEDHRKDESGQPEEREREQESDHGGAFVPAVDGPGDDTRNVDA